MKYQSYGPEQYRNMANGLYFVIKRKKPKKTPSVLLCEGHLLNNAMTVIDFSLTNCHLQKYRELTWDEESGATETLVEADVLKMEEHVPNKKEIAQIKRKRRKMTESQKRREYFDNFDKKTRAEQSSKYKNITGRTYIPGMSFRTNNPTNVITG